MIDVMTIRLRRIFFLFLGQFIIVSAGSNSIGRRNCSSDGNIISGKNIDHYQGCIEINGSVQIKNESFYDMHPSRLEIFQYVTTITGFLNIEGYHTDFKSLSFFRNLVLIHGHTPGNWYYTLNIDDTSLQSLDLLSLKQVKGIGAAISFNKHLCFANTIEWHHVVHGDGNAVVIGNREVRDCEMDRLVCDPQCSQEGCWGAGPDKCLNCRHYQQGNDCVEKCGTSKWSENSCRKACPINMFEDNGACKQCHDQCVGCNGTSANECTHCRHYKDEESCVTVCPESKYPMLGECRSCPVNCIFGCTATKNGVSCIRCAKNSHQYDRIFCKNTCPTGYFQSSNTNNESISCSLCHAECAECFEPGNSGCLSCKNKKLIYNDISHFICTSGFKELSNCIVDPTDASIYLCSHMNNRFGYVKFIIISIVFLISFLIGLTFIMKKLGLSPRVIKSNNPSILLLDSRYSIELADQIDTSFLNSQTTEEVIKKNFEKYTIDEETSSKGSFGTWCQGIEKSMVIIKLINEDLFGNSNTLLNKIVVISNLEHLYLLDVEVCLSEFKTVKIIAKQMPLGNVGDYIQRDLYDIQPLELLNWCKQIAQGMFYLESEKIIHGNLCARNILLTRAQGYSIKISNFYQYYLLGNNYKKSNIFGCCKKSKTLKVDCIQGHNFNHKSDVWAFGLTMYELLSFGKDPWEHITINNDGNMKTDFKWAINMPCPKMCSDNMYEILSKCWLRDPQDRPDFRELSEYFKNTLYSPDV